MLLVPPLKVPAIEAGVLMRTTPAPKPLSPVAAIAITRCPEPGEPPIKYVSPALPADATTTTPIRDALSDAIAVVSASVP